ncbi:VIT domain-containing protein [Candidatus Altiarchaeota archaeon]
MKLKWKILLVVLFFTLCVDLARADGFIIPEPIRPIPPHPPYPPPEIPYLAVKYHHVDVTIDNQYAETKIDQVFMNNYPRDLEGTYIFPLPEEASISKFSMYVDGEELTGEMLERDEARRIYEDIVRKMRDPALLEYVGRDMFKARVYPIPANDDKRVKLAYSEMIKCDTGICRYVYPLSTEKFSSEKLEDVYVKVVIESKIPIKSVYSPTHEVEVDWINENKVEVSYEDEDVLPKKDFEIIYTVSEEDFGLNLLTHRENGEDGFFVLMISPSVEAGDDEIIPKDVVLVLDTSGSMSGTKIVQAKDALEFCIESLNQEDRFNVVTFSSNVKKWRSGLVEVDEDSRDSAQGFLKKVKATGGTNIYDALEESLRIIQKDGEENRPKTIIFLTDGLPTVGTTNIERILQNVEDVNEAGARLFVFGVGYDVNTHLLDKLSEENSGVSEYVKPEEDIEVKVSNLYSKISSPVLTGLELDFGEIEVDEVYPVNLPDLYRGSQLTLFGRYDGSGDIEIKLTGYVRGEKERYTYEAYFPKIEKDNDFIPRLWATRKIGFLLDEIRLHGEEDELKDEIIELSLEYGIMTPYTSFLVQEDTDYAAPAVRRRGSREMLEKARNAFDSVLGATQFAAESGMDAVQAAVQTGGLKGVQIVQEDETGRIEAAGTKTFYQQQEVWVDQDFDPDVEALEIKYGSDAYFQLLDEDEDIGQYLSKGKDIDFCIRGKCFSIREDKGKEEVEPQQITIPPQPPDDITTTIPKIPVPIQQQDSDYSAIAVLAGLVILVIVLVSAAKKRE